MPSPLLLLAIAAAVASTDEPKPSSAPTAGNRPCADVYFFGVHPRFFALLQSRGRLQPNIAVADKGTLYVWSFASDGWMRIADNVADPGAALLAGNKFVDEDPFTQELK